MFGKDKPVDKDRDRAPAQPPQRSAVAPPAAKPEAPEMISSISSGMTVVGKIVGDGVVKIYGRVEGELQAYNVMICEGAQVEGNVVAQELTIAGRVKGTIHAGRVKLNGTAVVEGDIFHQSLSIEDNAQFEGSSRRVENPIEPAASNVRAAPAQRASTMSQSLHALGDMSPGTAGG